MDVDKLQMKQKGRKKKKTGVIYASSVNLESRQLVFD